MDPAANDIVYSAYSIDFVGLFQRLLGADTEGAASSFLDFLLRVWDVYSVLAILASIVFIILTIYAYLKINEYSIFVSEQIAAGERAWQEMHGAQNSNQRWQEVLAHAASDRPNDWKVAIIEADIMLGEALTERGYAGATIGEQLRGASPVHFATVQDAWDAHRIRNQIAHQGPDFVLTQGLVREAVVKYERVLRELGAV